MVSEDVVGVGEGDGPVGVGEAETVGDDPVVVSTAPVVGLVGADCEPSESLEQPASAIAIVAAATTVG